MLLLLLSEYLQVDDSPFIVKMHAIAIAAVKLHDPMHETHDSVIGTIRAHARSSGRHTDALITVPNTNQPNAMHSSRSWSPQ
jgi:hypothetical protein